MVFFIEMFSWMQYLSLLLKLVVLIEFLTVTIELRMSNKMWISLIKCRIPTPSAPQPVTGYW